MDFISQTLGNLTTGGKLYLLIQGFYLSGALFFTYVQWQILKELRKQK